MTKTFNHWPEGDLPLATPAQQPCRCGHAKSDHGDDPDRDGYNVCDSEHCPCEAYRPAGDTTARASDPKTSIYDRAAELCARDNCRCDDHEFDRFGLCAVCGENRP